MCKFIFLIIFWSTTLLAVASNSNFEVVNTQNTLSNNSITSIISDDYGFLWIGTEFGLTRFDGYTFTPFFANNENSIPNNHIKRIIKTSDGAIWVACSKGIARIDPLTLKITQPVSSDNALSSLLINTLHEDACGNIWIGTNSGVFAYSYTNKQIKRITVAIQNKTDFNVNFIESDRGKNVWIASNLGFCKIDAQSCYTLFSHPYSATVIPRDLHLGFLGIDTHNVLWYNNNRTTVCYQLDTDAQLANPTLINHNVDGKALYFIQNNDIIIGTRWNGALYIQRDTSGKIVSQEQFWMGDKTTLNLSNTVNSFYQDKWGNLWAGTKNGIFILKSTTTKSPFYHIQGSEDSPNTPSHNAISSFAEQPDGTVWIGTNHGINRFQWRDVATQQYAITRYVSNKNNDDNSNVVLSLLWDNDQLWVGTKAGISYFDTKKNSYLKHPETDRFLQSNNLSICKTLFKSQDGRIFIGFATGGVAYFDKNRNEFYLLESYKNRDVWAISRQKNGYLWVGTRNGLCLTKNYQNTSEKPALYLPNKSKKSIPNEWITALFVDSSDRLWVGTATGLCRYDPVNDDFEKIKLLDNDEACYISGIIADRHNMFWITTTKGIFRLDEKSDSAIFFELSNGNFASINYAFGMHLDAKGILFSGGINGLTLFRPEDIVLNANILPVYISRLTVNGYDYFGKGAINNQGTLRLNYDENQLTFSFSSLYYSNPYHIKYSYRLRGFENNWIYSDSRNFASYSKLPPGDYVFEVKSTDELGFMQNNIRAVTISILPPFWKTWWAYLLYIIAIIGLLGSIFHFTVERYRLIQAEKNNQWKFRLYTNITHGFKTPLSLMESPLQRLLKEKETLSETEKAKLLNILQRNIKRLSHLVNQLMDFRRIDRGKLTLHLVEADIKLLLEDVYNSFLTLSKSKHITFISDIAIPNVLVVFDYEKIETVLFNLLSNAFKFTEQGGKITLSAKIDSSKSFVTISVADTGIGIAEHYQDAIFERFWQENTHDNEENLLRGTGIGLSLAKEFVSLHKGNITVKSELGKGSTFQFSLLLGKTPFEGMPIGKHEEKKSYASNFVEIEENITDVEENNYTHDNNNKTRPLLFIIGDSSETLHYLQTNLSAEYDLQLFHDIKNVFSEVVNQNPVLIISDITIEGKEQGFQLCKLIKKDIITSHIPVILFTESHSEQNKISSYEVGADAFVENPFEINYLLVRIKQLLHNREKQREKIKMDLIINPKEISTTSAVEKFMIDVMNVIETNLDDEDFSLEDFAKEMSISRSILSNKLQAITGQTPIEFLRNIRLKRAAQLLSQNAFSISEISYKVGFSSPRYFSTIFKKQFDMTPKEYAAVKHLKK